MLTSGTVLQQNRYRIEAVLGQGGMGAVYRAWHLGLEKVVAVKELTPQPELDAETLAQLRAQFKREAITLARLDHPNLVRVLDSFEEDGNVYLVMDLVEGESLAERIERSGKVSEAEVIWWASALLDALAYCHNQGVFHRDIKPHNIIVGDDGWPVLVDFGLVKLWDPDDPHTKTVMRGLGTPEYAPPEQYDVHGHTDGRSDLYSLGATFYHALTGISPPTVTQRVVNPDVLRPLRELLPDLNSQLAAIVMRMIELRPADRFQNAEGLSMIFANELLPAIETTDLAASAPDTGTTQAMSSSPPRKPITGGKTPVTRSAFRKRQPATSSVTERIPEADAAAVAAVVDAEAATSAEPRRPIWRRLRRGHIVLVVIGLLMLLCVCMWMGGDEPLKKPINSIKSTLAPIVATKADVAEDKANTMATTAAADSAEEPALRIGLVTAVGPVDDGGFNQSAWDGVQETSPVYGAEVDFVETEDAAHYVENIQRFAEEGFDVIVTVGFAMNDATVEMARAYPDVTFIGVDQYQDEPLPNLTGLIFREEQLGYLAGSLAAYATETEVIGTVLGSEAVEPVVAFKEGYESGARMVKPNVEVLSVYHPGEVNEAFVDPEWGAATAAEMIAANADVIFAAAGETGNGALMEAAAHEGVLCIGVDTDQWETVPEAQSCLVTSAVKHIDSGIVELVGLWLEGDFPGGNYYGSVGLAPFHDFDEMVPSVLREFLQELEVNLREEIFGVNFGN